jgi:hypothetical protein
VRKRAAAIPFWVQTRDQHWSERLKVRSEDRRVRVKDTEPSVERDAHRWDSGRFWGFHGGRRVGRREIEGHVKLTKFWACCEDVWQLWWSD